MKLLTKLLNFLRGLKKEVDQQNHFLSWHYKSPKVLQGRLLAELNSSKKPKCLSELEFQVFSQFGDDGIIQWLVHKLPLPNKTFIEFGVEDYKESNTRFLLFNNYWSGLILDGSIDNINKIKKEYYYLFFDLQAEASFVTVENINDLIKSSGFENDIGILSIDIDGNDYWVWNAINSISPIIVIVEYNSLFGWNNPYTIPYNPSFIRGVDSPFNLYGASIMSLNELAISKGYNWIGCNSAGNNAYFIRSDYMKYLNMVVKPPESMYNFAQFTEVSSNGLPLRGKDNLMSIDGQTVYNTQTSQLEKVDAQEIIKSLLIANKLRRSK